jgi:hypothetical protein
MSKHPMLLLVVLLSTAFHMANTFLFAGRSISTSERNSKPVSRHQDMNVPFLSTVMRAVSHSHASATPSTRRAWMMNSTKAMLAGMGVVSALGTNMKKALALEDYENPDVPPLDDLYDNPNMPQAPEEKSGLVVLRVAEVAEFQEKILRAVVNGDLGGDITVSPQQIVFGTQILLRNSNLDGNMKLMIYQEIPRKSRNDAIKNAVKTMNTIQDIVVYASKIQRPFEKEEMLQVADMYRTVKVLLNQMYEYLPPPEREKYYGYFVAVTEYEKKIANGTYNPDIDGILQFDN